MSEFRFTNQEWREYQNMPDQGYSHRGFLEFVVNRWLAEVKAEPCQHNIAEQLEEYSLRELIRMAKADAWDEGYTAGGVDAWDDVTGETDNPYREGELSE